MRIVTESFDVGTKSRNQAIDITDKVQSIVDKAGIKNGDVIAYCPHTTAGITINENADPDVMHDVLLTLNELVPVDRQGYQHGEGNSDAHCKSSIIGCSVQVLVKGGQLLLGSWQGIYFCEFDGPRSRKVFVQVRGE